MSTRASRKLTRLLNLTALLLQSRRPLSASEIRDRLDDDAYSRRSDIRAFRRTFERDKRDLQSIGVPITAEKWAYGDPSVDYYTLDPAVYADRDIGFEPDELAALHLATRRVRLPGTAGVFLKTGIPSEADLDTVRRSDPTAGGLDARQVAELQYRDAVTPLASASSKRMSVRFRYRKADGTISPRRVVEPWHLEYAHGHWYLTGWDRTRADRRLFRVDRIAEGSVFEFDKAKEPVGPKLDVASMKPWDHGAGEPVSVRVLVDADLAALAATRAGVDGERQSDGSLILTLRVRNSDALRSFVLEFSEHAEVIEPEHVRQEIITWIEALIDSSSPGTQTRSSTEAPRRSARSSSTCRPLDAVSRTQRLLGLLPWVAARSGASIEEITARFDYPREDLISDLQALQADEDAHTDDRPFSAVDIDWCADSEIHIRCPRWMSDPIRLNADESARLLATAKAALSTDLVGAVSDVSNGEMSALTRAVAKLQLMLDDRKRGLTTRQLYAESADDSAVGAVADTSIEVSLGQASEAKLSVLRKAVGERRVIEIDYYSYARDELTRRSVDPTDVFSHKGAWYLAGWCHRARAERTFRVERIRSLRVTGSEASTEHYDDVSTAFAFDAGSRALKVTLVLERAALWAADHYPVLDRRELGDGRTEIDLAVSEPRWLARILLMLGPHAELVSDDPELAGLVPAAAARVLKRYR